jgi:hypothetical protein
MRLGEASVVMVVMSGLGAFVYTIQIVVNAIVRGRDKRNAALSPAVISDERLARVEAAVEAIAIEVERISEGQRFTTRLLTEQKQQVPLVLPRPGKFDTPH